MVKRQTSQKLHLPLLRLLNGLPTTSGCFYWLPASTISASTRLRQSGTIELHARIPVALCVVKQSQRSLLEEVAMRKLNVYALIIPLAPRLNFTVGTMPCLLRPGQYL